MITIPQILIAILTYAITGMLDWLIKESPCYPNKRPDTLWWCSIWGVICWSVPIGLIAYLYGWLVLVFLPLAFIEDQTYFLFRAVVYQEPYTDILWFPFPMLGYNQLPMKYIQLFTTIYLTLLIIGSLIW